MPARFRYTVAAIGIGLIMLAASPALAAWTAGNYLKFGIGARALGMGNSFVAVADDATAIYWNPAGLTLGAGHEAFLSYADRFGLGIADQSGGVALRWRERFRVGFAIVRSSVDGIKRTSLGHEDENDRPVIEGTFGDAQMAMFFSAAFRIHEVFSFGVSTKLLSHELARQTAHGFGVDIGWLLHPMDILSFGMNAQNINRPRMEWNTGSGHFDRVPANFKFGGAITLLPSKLRISSDLNIPDFGDLNLNSGLEYSPTGHFTLRGGLARSELATGASFELETARLDYAFQDNELGDTHRFALQFSF